jgi:hypothetical protein
MTLRLAPSQYAKLQQIDNWQEKVRLAIASLVESEQGQLDSAATENAIATNQAGGTPQAPKKQSQPRVRSGGGTRRQQRTAKPDDPRPTNEQTPKKMSANIY